MFRLTVRMARPMPLAMDIAVPAQCLLGLGGLATGATIGVTTRRRARQLTARIDGRACSEEVLLLGERIPRELGDITGLWCGPRGRD